uniref:Adenylate kinase n=1 Tax=Mastigamoeba balamuthi TaxID=108607 RepID=A0A0F6NYH3_MASBA|nr:adenylate kinase [Mastigamoeba balamuthi]
MSKPIVVFVLGGPGSGKGTQSEKIVEKFGFAHFSAGDLLRAEVASGSPHGTMISEMIKAGKIVPSSVTVGLLKKAIETSPRKKILIDGFPRSAENNGAWEQQMNAVVDMRFVLFFDCPEETMLQRLLHRSGPVTRTGAHGVVQIKKRFATFRNESIPVVEYYEKQGKVRRVRNTLAF